MSALSNEEREKLIRQSLWTGVGTGLGLFVAGLLLSVFGVILHYGFGFLRHVETVVDKIPG